MRKIKIGLTVTSILAMLSCKKDFLDTEPTRSVSKPLAEYKLNGLYPMMINTRTGGTTGHDDFGQKGYDIMTDMLSSDMALVSSSYGWFGSTANLSAMKNVANTMNYLPWRYYYRIINAANDVIGGLGGNSATLVPSKESDKYALGQAKTIRAYAYFYLLQLYTPEFNASNDAIPMYLEANSPAKAVSKQSEVYALIEEDLKHSISLLNGFTRANKSQIDVNVAKGILAYTYAAQGKNAEVATTAFDIVNTSGYPVTTKTEAVRMRHDGPNTDPHGGGFNNIATPSWMWGFDLIEDNAFDLASWWGQMDIFTYGYAWAGDKKAMDKNLYDAMRSDDIRKNQFGTYGGSINIPYNKFFAPARKIGGQRTVVSDYVFMRIDEFHLLAAEGFAKSGNESQARTILKNYLLNNRLSNVSYIDTLSGKALEDEIYLQTRLEFWGEGKSYLAMKRNRATVSRGSNHLYLAGETFQHNQEGMFFKIPESEVLNNPFMN